MLLFDFLFNSISTRVYKLYVNFPECFMQIEDETCTFGCLILLNTFKIKTWVLNFKMNHNKIMKSMEYERDEV